MEINLRRSTFWGVLEVLISGVSLFILYKFILSFVGLKGLGLWSIVLATTSLARLADIGAAAGLTRFIAIGSADGFSRETGAYVDTAYAINVTLYSLIGLLLIVPLWFALEYVVPAESLAAGRQLLPYALGSLILLNANGVTLSALLGIQRGDLKSKLVIASIIVQIVCVALTIQSFGLLAVAWGQMAQYAMVTIVGRLLLIRLMPGADLAFLPLRITKAAIRNLFTLGMKLQAATLVAFVFEPFTKLVLSSTAGLEAVGLFEMASRVALQARHIAYLPMQSLVSAFARIRKSDPARLADFYQTAFANGSSAGLLLMSAVFIASPIVSVIWLGTVSADFVAITAIICVARFVHLFATPSYMMAVGEGKILGNLFGHVLTSLVFPAIAYASYMLIPTQYTIIGVAMAGMAVGELFSYAYNTRMFGLPHLPAPSYLKANLIYLRRLSSVFERRS